jgi:hypothetical protein
VGVMFQLMILWVWSFGHLLFVTSWLLLRSLHLVFFIWDVVLGVKILWQNGVGWRFPTGQFTVEFTVKVLRQRDDSRGLVDSWDW